MALLAVSNLVQHKRTWACTTSTTRNPTPSPTVAPPPPLSVLRHLDRNSVSFCGGCPGYHGPVWPTICPRSWGRLMKCRVPNPPPRGHSACSLPSGPFVHHLLHILPLSLAVDMPPPVLPPSLLPALLLATHLATLRACCGSQSRLLRLFASRSVPCRGEPPLSCAIAGQTAQAHYSPPPFSLSTSRHLLIRMVATVGPTGSCAQRLCPCISLASSLHHPLPINCPLPPLPPTFCLFVPFFCFFGLFLLPLVRPCHFATLLPLPSNSHPLAPMPLPVPISTPILPLLVPMPQHCGQPMAHIASPTLAVAPPPHTGTPATPTSVCAKWRGMSLWGSARSPPPPPN